MLVVIPAQCDPARVAPQAFRGRQLKDRFTEGRVMGGAIMVHLHAPGVTAPRDEGILRDRGVPRRLALADARVPDERSWAVTVVDPDPVGSLHDAPLG